MIDHERGLGVTLRVLEATTARTKVILHNIANQNTPGYKRYEVQFESLLRKAHAAGRDTSDVRPVVTRDESGAPGQNNVSVVEELALLEKVSLLHDMFSRRAGGYFRRLNKAISGQG